MCCCRGSLIGINHQGHSSRNDNWGFGSHRVDSNREALYQRLLRSWDRAGDSVDHGEGLVGAFDGDTGLSRHDGW